MKFLIPIFFLFLIPVSVDAVIYADKPSSLLDSFYIETEEEKTKENIIRYFNNTLDGSYSDEFIDKVSDYAYDRVGWMFFTEKGFDLPCIVCSEIKDQSPLFFLRTINVHLPDTRGLTDVYRIDHQNNIWITTSGIEYQKNDFDSFKRITPITIDKTCNENHQVTSRNYCEFDDMKELENLKATMYLKSHQYKLFDEPFDKINNIFAYEFSEIDSRTQFLMVHGLYDWARLGADYDSNGVDLE